MKQFSLDNFSQHFFSFPKKAFHQHASLGGIKKKLSTLGCNFFETHRKKKKKQKNANDCKNKIFSSSQLGMWTRIFFSRAEETMIHLVQTKNKRLEEHTSQLICCDIGVYYIQKQLQASSWLWYPAECRIRFSTGQKRGMAAKQKIPHQVHMFHFIHFVHFPPYTLGIRCVKFY